MEHTKDEAHYIINIPESAIGDINPEILSSGTMQIKEDRVFIAFGSRVEHIHIKARWYAIPALLMTAIFVILFWNRPQIPLSGGLSIASVVIATGLVSGMTSFTYFYARGKEKTMHTAQGRRFLRNLPALMISFTIILTSGLIILFKVLGDLFAGASFDLATSSLFVFTLLAIFNYLMIYIALSMTPRMLIQSLSLFIVGGVGLSMILNQDQQWWIANFSFLGTHEARYAWQFNLTLILSALLMIALVDSIFEALYKVQKKTWQLTTLKSLLIATAICLGGVGAFPHNDIVLFQMLHNRSAGFLVYLVIALILFSRWLLPSLTKDFLKLSYIVGGTLVVVSVLFEPIGYLSLTAFELIAFMLAFSWLILLLKNIVDFTENGNTLSFPVSFEYAQNAHRQFVPTESPETDTDAEITTH